MNVKNFDELYPGRFLKAGLVINKPTFTISDVYLDSLEGEKGTQKKGVIKFSDSEFELTLNKTNGTCLKAMFGKELATWIGKRITLCSEIVQFGKEKVDAVRILGSPDISEDVNATIQMPRKKPQTRVLLKTAESKRSEFDALLANDCFTVEEKSAFTKSAENASDEKLSVLIQKLTLKMEERLGA